MESPALSLDILIIAPHPDDAELGMAGAILKFKEEGRKVGVLDLTSGEPTPHGTLEIRAKETAAATEILGLDWRENLGLPNRSLEPTLEARHKLAAVFRRVRPQWLFAPYWVDAHPDHVAATQLIEAARFWSKLTKSDIPGEPPRVRLIAPRIAERGRTLTFSLPAGKSTSVLLVLSNGGGRAVPYAVAAR